MSALNKQEKDEIMNHNIKNNIYDKLTLEEKVKLARINKDWNLVEMIFQEIEKQKDMWICTGIQWGKIIDHLNMKMYGKDYDEIVCKIFEEFSVDNLIKFFDADENRILSCLDRKNNEVFLKNIKKRYNITHNAGDNPYEDRDDQDWLDLRREIIEKVPQWALADWVGSLLIVQKLYQ